MSPGKNPGGCSRLSAKAFVGILTKSISKIMNKINGFYRGRRIYEKK